MKIVSNLKNLILLFYILGMSLFIIFGRSFSGLKISIFRIGELAVGFLIIFSFVTIALKYKNKNILKNLIFKLIHLLF